MQRSCLHLHFPPLIKNPFMIEAFIREVLPSALWAVFTKKSPHTFWPSTQRAELVGPATVLHNPTAVRNSQCHLHRGFSRCTSKTRWWLLERKAWRTFKPSHLCKTASSAFCMAGFLLHRSVGIIKRCPVQWVLCSQQEMPDFIFGKDERKNRSKMLK